MLIKEYSFALGLWSILGLNTWMSQIAGIVLPWLWLVLLVCLFWGVPFFKSFYFSFFDFWLFSFLTFHFWLSIFFNTFGQLNAFSLLHNSLVVWRQHNLYNHMGCSVAVANMLEWPLCTQASLSLGWVPGRGLTGSKGTHIFSSNRHCQIAFQSSHTHIYLHQ